MSSCEEQFRILLDCGLEVKCPVPVHLPAYHFQVHLIPFVSLFLSVQSSENCSCYSIISLWTFPRCLSWVERFVDAFYVTSKFLFF